MPQVMTDKDCPLVLWPDEAFGAIYAVLKTCIDRGMRHQEAVLFLHHFAHVVQAAGEGELFHENFLTCQTTYHEQLKTHPKSDVIFGLALSLEIADDVRSKILGELEEAAEPR